MKKGNNSLASIPTLPGGALKGGGKYQELLSGTFHEVADKMLFIDVALVKELLEKKRGYKEMEEALGIFKR